MDAERNLLFAVLALRANLIDADRFAEACLRWTLRTERPLPEVLVEQGWLTADDRHALTHLTERNIQNQAGDVRAAVAALADRDVRRSLASVQDPEFQRWLAGVLPGALWIDEPERPRRMVGALAALLVVIVAVVGLGGLVMLAGGALLFSRQRVQVEMARAEEARAVALQAEARAEAERARAEANFQKARQAVDAVFTQAAEDRAGEEGKSQQILEEAVQFYLKQLQQGGDDPKVRGNAGRVLRRLADLYREQGKRAEAEPTYRKALTLQEKLATDFPKVPDYRRELALSQAHLGALFRDTGRLAEAEAIVRQALALQTHLATDSSAVADYQRDLAESYTELGKLLEATGRSAEAKAVREQARALEEKLEQSQKEK